MVTSQILTVLSLEAEKRSWLLGWKVRARTAPLCPERVLLATPVSVLQLLKLVQEQEKRIAQLEERYELITDFLQERAKSGEESE